MRLPDWLAYQQTQHPNAIELGLDRVRQVACRLERVPWKIPSIIVGGTNGKGSTVAFLTALARAVGLKVGTYTSPHLQRYNERIAIDTVPVDDAALIAAFERIEAAREGVPLTFFEYGTLAAFEIFGRERIDVAIVEVGLGGRLDATNIIDADVAVLTSVGLDHQEWLGATVEDIGREKSGILRAGKPVVLGATSMPKSVRLAIDALGARAREIDVDFRIESAGEGAEWCWQDALRRYAPLPPPALHGPIQPRNAATAIAAFLELLAAHPQLAPIPSIDAIATAMRRVELRGRFQRIAPQSALDPEWILDVAHNEDSAQVLATALRSLPRARRTVAVIGVLGDKDAAAIAQQLETVIDEWVLCGVAGPRGGSAEALRSRLPATLRTIALAPDVSHGCATARALAGAADRIVVFGSFHVVGPALDWLRI
jgi:dihydrofolate synthase/folylpolyglutamate synthase